jgi:hypothetical protein
MTTTDCFVTLVGLDSHTDAANPEPFRSALPQPRPGHYWAPAVERFAKERGLAIQYPVDNLTPQITLSGPDVRMLLVEAYGDGADFVRSASAHLTPASLYEVYAEDF